MMDSLRVVIADDEPDAREKLQRLLEAEDRTTVVAEATNGIDAVEVIRSLAPDVVFLDIRMPELDGFGVVEALADAAVGPKIIFATAYNEYAVRAFEVRALDYMLKPFDGDRLAEALRRVRQMIEYEHRPSAGTLRSMLGTIRDIDEAVIEPAVGTSPPRYLERICIRSRGRTEFVRVSDIEWIEAYGNYVRLHTPKGRALLRHPLRRFSEQLDPTVFCRVHRSAVINMHCIETMRPCNTGDYILQLRSGIRVKLSRVFRAELDRRLGRKRSTP